MNKTKIIVVEDNIVYCEYVCNMLSREGYRNMKAYHLSTAKKHLQQATDNDIVVADLRLPDGSGIDLLCWMRKEGKMQPFIIMTDYAEVNTAVESMKLGSIDYIPKQLVEDKLVPLIRSILKERQAGQRRMPIFAREGSAFQKIMHRIRLVAATDMSVMIFGENGTGKEHIAHLLHDKSKRAGKPFVAVDCGSLSKELAPSAFFGHVKGAFTGADNAKKGYFHEAEGGTLFLDEVGNLALETQQMLLRAIQERRYRPVGDKADRNFNVRIIAATNEDLEVSVNEKRFRQDLLYRLHDFGLLLPYANLTCTIVLAVIIGLVISSAFSAILVYATDLMPGKVGMVAGIFFGLMFGLGGLGSAFFGWLADKTSIEFIFRISTLLPLLGIITGFLPNIEGKTTNT